MRVLFFNPSRAGQGNMPLNIPLLIAVLKKHGHEVRLFEIPDYAAFDEDSYDNMFFKPASFDIDRLVKDRAGFYKDKFGVLVDGHELKKTDYNLDFERVLNDYNPQIIAVSCLSVDFYFASEFLLPYKEKYKIPVIFGGIHAILLPEETLNAKVCDYVCIGEGERAFPVLLEAMENNKPLESVKGIWFKKGHRIIKNEPMDLTNLATLCALDFELFDPIHFYRPFDGKKYKMLNYELSRGCPFNCSYCVNGTLQKKYMGLGKYHRVKKISQSINELKYMVNRYNFDFVRFWDEDFTSIRTSYLKEYAKEYLKEIHLPFLVYARVDTVTEEKVKILKKMGCRTFAMGIESGNDFIRKSVMNRHISTQAIIEKFNLVKSYGIRVSAYNIIGLPCENRKTIFDTIDLNRNVDPDSLSVTILEPYKGTPIREMCEKEGLDLSRENIFDKPQFVPRGMTRGELLGLYRTFSFYIRFPKSRYDEINRAETDDVTYARLKEEFEKLK